MVHSLSGCVALISMSVNLFLYYLVVPAFSCVYQLSIILQCSIALISFIRLKQADQLLRQTLSRLSSDNKDRTQESQHRKRQSIRTSYIRSSVLSSLNLFYQFHTECRQSVFSQNRIFGSILFIHILVYTPANAFMVWSLIFGRIELVTGILFAG